MARRAAFAASAALLLAAGAAAAEELDFTAEPFKVLLTGFGAFLDVKDNPTSKSARKLAGTCGDARIAPDPAKKQVWAKVRICWEAHVLPVNRTGANWTTQHLRGILGESKTVPYHAIFHTGFEDDAKGLKLEIAAANIQADDSGAPGTLPAIPGQPRILSTTVNTGWLDLASIADIAPGVVAASERELWSRDPGTYYCNEVYYRTLEFIRYNVVTVATGALLPAMFVHMPNTDRGSVDDDVEVLSLVAAHALWASYLDGRQKSPPCSSLASDVESGPPAWQLGLVAALGLAVGAFGAALLMLWPGRRKGPASLGASLLVRDSQVDVRV